MSPPELIPDPEITTSTGSGTALITLLGPIPENRNQISSSHVGASGAQTIMYPEDWEGIVTCQVQVGSCHMWGKGLEIVETRNNNTGQHSLPRSLALRLYADIRSQRLHESSEGREKIQRSGYKHRTSWWSRRSRHRPSRERHRETRIIGDPQGCHGAVFQRSERGVACIWFGEYWYGFFWRFVGAYGEEGMLALVLAFGFMGFSGCRLVALLEVSFDICYRDML